MRVSTFVTVSILLVLPSMAWSQMTPEPEAIAVINFSCAVQFSVLACYSDEADPTGNALIGDQFASTVSVNVTAMGIEGSGVPISTEVAPTRCMHHGAAAPVAPNYCGTVLEQFTSSMSTATSACAVIGKPNGTDVTYPDGAGFVSGRGAMFYCAGSKPQIISHFDKAIRTAISLAPLAAVKPPKER